MTSAPTDCRVPDPTDAKADGNFGTHRAGYGDGRLQRITHAARQGWTLAAGEGAALVEEIDRLREERDAMEGMYRHHVVVALGAIERLNRAEAILAKLRNPSEAVMVGAFSAGAVWDVVTHTRKTIQLAVAAAEREVP